MHGSAESKSALRLLGSLGGGMNSLLFYDSDKTLDKFLSHYVKTGLQNGGTVIYLTGIRTIDEAEQKLIDAGIDCVHHERNGTLQLMSYDDIFLVDGRIELLNAYRNMLRIVNNHNGNSTRLATESNWWLLADVFENAIDMEAAHEILPNNMSAVCTYSIKDLMEYANIYHLAKLMELHHKTLLLTKDTVMLPLEFYSYLGKCIISVLENDFDYITIIRKKHSRFISEILLELEMRIGVDMVKLERNVEEKLISMLKLDNY